MDTKAQSFILAILMAGLAAGQTPKYVFEPSEGSRFALEVYKTGLMAGKKHVFVFERFSGSATAEQARFVVDARSIVCTDKWVNEGSRKKIERTARDQALEADKFPELVFTSSKVTAKAEGEYDVEGSLAIRGVAKPVVVHVTRKGEEFEGNAVLKLSDWGIKAPSSGLSLGLIGTKNEMSAQFRLKAK